jgi:hypothetical protein
MATGNKRIGTENTVVDSPRALTDARFGAIPEDAQISREKRGGALTASSSALPRNVLSVLEFNVIRSLRKRLNSSRCCFYTGVSKSLLTGLVITPGGGEFTGQAVDPCRSVLASVDPRVGKWRSMSKAFSGLLRGWRSTLSLPAQSSHERQCCCSSISKLEISPFSLTETPDSCRMKTRNSRRALTANTETPSSGALEKAPALPRFVNERSNLRVTFGKTVSKDLK